MCGIIPSVPTGFQGKGLGLGAHGKGLDILRKVDPSYVYHSPRRSLSGLPTFTVRIDKLGHRAIGIGRVQGKVVMVPFSAPGDLLEVEVTRSHRSYEEARIVKVLEPSSFRREPPCVYFGICGGCQLQHIEVGFQRSQKGRIMKEMLRAVAGEGTISETISGSNELGYRCRLDLHIMWGRGPQLALHRWASGDLVVLDRCLLAAHTINASFSIIQRILLEAKEKVLGRVEIVCDAKGEDISLFLSRASVISPRAKAMLRDAGKAIPSLRSLCYKPLGGTKVETLLPQDGGALGVVMELRVDGVGSWGLEVWPGVFIQVNPEINNALVNTLCCWALELKPTRVLDLFAGMGNFSIPLSRVASEVWAVELDPRAVANGNANCRRLAIDNITWIRGAARAVVSELISRSLSFDLVVLDPPRSGAPDVVRKLSLLDPKAIVYVSCDPPSLSRDAAIIQGETPYRLTRIQPFDMFPQTYHLEALALFVRP